MEPLHIDIHQEWHNEHSSYYSVVLKQGKRECEEFGFDGIKDLLDKPDTDIIRYVAQRDGAARDMISSAKAEHSEIVVKKSGIDDEIAMMRKNYEKYRHAWETTGSKDFVAGLLKRFRLPEDVKQELRALPTSDTLVLYERVLPPDRRVIGHSDFVTRSGSANINIYTAVAAIKRSSTIIDFLEECRMKHADRDTFELLAGTDGCALLANSDRATANAAIAAAQRYMTTLSDDDPRKAAVKECVKQIQDTKSSSPVTSSVAPKPRCPGM